MKVLIVNKFLYPNGGSETYIFKVGEQLIKMGHGVEYFGMEHENRRVGNRAGSFTENMDFHTGKLSRLLYPFKIIYSAEAARKIRIVLEDFEPDVVHLNNFNFQLTPSIIYEIRRFEKRSGRSIRIVYTAHDYQWVCPNHMMFLPEKKECCFLCKGGRFMNCTRNRCIHGSLVKSLLGSMEGIFYHRLKTYRLVDTIICPSDFLNEQLSTCKELAFKTVTLHNFIDGGREKQTDADNPRLHANRLDTCETSVTGKSEKGEYVIYFGRYSQEKGIGTLTEVCRSLPDIPFVFAGSGPMEKELKGIQNIKNVGFLQGEKLRKLIEQARFSVFPSEWYENCPFSVMEAQMYGTPVLASDLGGTPELVTDGVTGELYEAGNKKQLMEKIRTLWEDREKCLRYSKHCKDTDFDTLEIYCTKLVKLYQTE